MVITLVGAGNLATQLGFALQAAGHIIAQVWSRSEASARRLAGELRCPWTTAISDLHTDVDLLVLAVKDSALATLAQSIHTQALVAHTAGSLPLEILPQERAGVLYPMQTFSKGRRIDFRDIPCFVETRRPEDLLLLLALAQSLSQHVTCLSSARRRSLHLAAVFACNFTNRCYDLAAQVLEREGIPFSTLLPLIDETTAKIHSLSPREAQTGPAVRWDENVIQAHLALLPEGEERDIYRLLSQSIHQRHIAKE